MEEDESAREGPSTKCTKIDEKKSWYSDVKHGKGRLIPRHILEKFTQDDIKLLEEVKSSSIDLELILKAIKFRKLHRLCLRLPDDAKDSEYYFQDGLRKVYPYNYLYQTYAKRRWNGRKLIEILKQEFRDIPYDQLKRRFEKQRVLVNGDTVDHE